LYVFVGLRPAKTYNGRRASLIPTPSPRSPWEHIPTDPLYTLGAVGEELLEAEAIEEPARAGDDEPAAARPLPERARGVEVGPWRGEIRTVAIAAAGGIVAGAATVAAVRATRAAAAGPQHWLRRRPRERMPGVIASRSFIVDVHLLDR
jgi:hypothetical protein